MRQIVGILIAGAIASIWATPAQADYSSPEHLDKWQVVQLGQCKAILNMGAFRLDPSGRKDEGGWDITKTEWTGACDANGLITGNGVIRLYTWIQNPDGSFFTNYYQEYRVNAAGGMVDGPVAMATANYDRDRGAYQPAEVWTEEPGYRRRFDRGCLRDEFEETGCDPAAGERFRQQYLGPRATSPVTTAPVVKPLPQSPVPQVSGGGGGSSAGARAGVDEATKLVANGLMQLLGGGGASSFSSKEEMISQVLTSLSATLTGQSSPLSSQPGLADTILGMVAGELSRSQGGQSTGQIIDLVNKVIGSAMQQGAPTPAPAPMTAAPVMQSGVPASVVNDAFALNAGGLTQAFARLGKTIAPNGSETNFQFFQEAGNLFGVQLYCPSGGQCGALVLKACYAYPNASIGRTNVFNREKLFARAYIAENGNVCIDEVVHGEGGSMSFANLQRALSAFEASTGEAKARFDAP